MADSIHERGRAMEDLFFQQKDQKLLESLKRELCVKESRDQLEAASGIHDKVVLDHLIDQGVTAETLLAVGMIPLVEVAWADNKVEPAERESILKSAEQAGIEAGSASYQILEIWLNKRPDAGLFSTWVEYIGELKNSLDHAAMSQLEKMVIERAEHVAKSAGGFLGLVNPISEAEKRVLAKLKAAFQS